MATSGRFRSFPAKASHLATWTKKIVFQNIIRVMEAGQKDTLSLSQDTFLLHAGQKDVLSLSQDTFFLDARQVDHFLEKEDFCLSELADGSPW